MQNCFVSNRIKLSGFFLLCFLVWFVLLLNPTNFAKIYFQDLMPSCDSTSFLVLKDTIKSE